MVTHCKSEGIRIKSRRKKPQGKWLIPTNKIGIVYINCLYIINTVTYMWPIDRFIWFLLFVFHKLQINSLVPGGFRCDFKSSIFKLVLLIGTIRASLDKALRWMPWDFTDDKSTLVQVMAWCRQAPSHYLSQCWPRSMSPYGVTKPQWVKWTVNILPHLSTFLSSISICLYVYTNVRPFRSHSRHTITAKILARLSPDMAHMGEYQIVVHFDVPRLIHVILSVYYDH